MSENKGTDQCLCFRICRLLVFSCRGSHVFNLISMQKLAFLKHRRDIPIGVSLYSTPTGTAYIEQIVESQKSTRTAKKENTVLS